MNKLLIFCLLLPLCTKAQKIEIATGNGVIVGFPDNPFNIPYFTGKVMYNINKSLQVGLNGRAGANSVGEGFINWRTAIRNNVIYAGVNAGYTKYGYSENGHPGVWVQGKGFTMGIQTGYTTPVTSPIGFYIEMGLSKVYAAREGFYNGVSTGQYSREISDEASVYIPISMGLRYRFAYKHTKQESTR